MSLSDILARISSLVRYFVFPGSTSSAFPAFVKSFADFIVTHKLILFFVLLSLLSFGITLIRRLCK